MNAEDEGDKGDDEIEKIIEDITSMIRTKQLSAEYKQVERAMLSEERQMEFRLVAKMAWLIYHSFVSEGFTENQAFKLTEMMVESTVLSGTKDLN